jgi:hypothetical protein
MLIRRSMRWFVLLLMAAFFTLSMAEAIAMPRALTGNASGTAAMDMPDCADMKMPVPCKDPKTLCLGAICIPMISFFAPASTAPVSRTWTMSVYDGRLAPVLQGRSIAPALEPPIFVG